MHRARQSDLHDDGLGSDFAQSCGSGEDVRAQDAGDLERRYGEAADEQRGVQQRQRQPRSGCRRVAACSRGGCVR